MTKKKLRDYYWKNTASSIYEYILFIYLRVRSILLFQKFQKI